jgi:hypothetical protein
VAGAVPSPGLAARIDERPRGSPLLLKKGCRTETGVAVDAEGPLQKVALRMRLGGRLLRRKKEEKEKLRKEEEKRSRSKHKNFQVKSFSFQLSNRLGGKPEKEAQDRLRDVMISGSFWISQNLFICLFVLEIQSSG